MNLKYMRRKPTPFIRRWFRSTTKITSDHIKVALYKAVRGRRTNDIEDVARLLYLVLCVYYLFATTGTKIKWGFITYVEIIYEMR